MANSRTTMLLVLVVAAPVAVAVLLYRLAGFEAVSLPEHVFSRSPPIVPQKRYSRVLESAERVGEGLISGPEDLAYDAETGHIYAGCNDGWIKRLHVSDAADEEKMTKTKTKTQVEVENWAFTGGRPLGLAFGSDKQLIVANANKGLLSVSKEGAVELLTDEAGGLKFKLTNGVDVGRDGVIYFTDSSYKYTLEEYMLGFFEGRPYGRLMSYDPSINKTQELAHQLYFANGVALSPNKDFLIFCESWLRKCSKYHIQGEKQGSIETFLDNLPGLPDNIHYGEGCFWITLYWEKTIFWDALLRYPIIRKMVWLLEKVLTARVVQSSNGGVMEVNLEGEAIALYSDPGLSMVTGSIKVRNQLYLGSIANTYVTLVNLNKL